MKYRIIKLTKTHPTCSDRTWYIIQRKILGLWWTCRGFYFTEPEVREALESRKTKKRIKKEIIDEQNF